VRNNVKYVSILKKVSKCSTNSVGPFSVQKGCFPSTVLQFSAICMSVSATNLRVCGLHYMNHFTLRVNSTDSRLCECVHVIGSGHVKQPYHHVIQTYILKIEKKETFLKTQESYCR